MVEGTRNLLYFGRQFGCRCGQPGHPFTPSLTDPWGIDIQGVARVA